MKITELFGKPADPNIPPKEPFSTSAIVFAYIGVIAALAISLTLNIYHDTHADSSGKAHFHSLPFGIALMVGVGVPLMCGVLSHLAAEVDIGVAGKLIIYGIVAALMYVSAKAGTAVMTPILGSTPALILSVATDAGAMFCIHTLMVQQERKTACRAWAAGESERLRAAAEQQRQAEAAVLAGRSSGSRQAVTPRDNTPRAAAGNTAGNTRNNTSDNTRPAEAGNIPATAPRQASGNGTGERPGSPGNVTPITRRQAPVSAAESGKAQPKTDQEILLLIEDFYRSCVESGEGFGTRAFIRVHGGSPNRVGKLIERFLESRSSTAQDAADGQGVG